MHTLTCVIYFNDKYIFNSSCVFSSVKEMAALSSWACEAYALGQLVRAQKDIFLAACWVTVFGFFKQEVEWCRHGLNPLTSGLVWGGGGAILNILEVAYDRNKQKLPGESNSDTFQAFRKA